MKTILLILIVNMLYPGKRQVLIFYSAGGNTYKNEQLQLFNEHKKEIDERDIEIHTFKINDAQAATKQWNIPASTTFAFILVGKDGGEKLRADTVVSTKQLFATIDAMPMRKQEMKHKK